MADEAFAVPHVLCSFTGREIEFIHIHHVRVPGRSGGSRVLSWWDVAISPTLEFPESYHISVKFPCLVEPLFPLPPSLFLLIGEGGSGHYDSELIGYSSLEGIHEDAVIINSAVCLGQFESSGVFVEVPVKLVHTKGINSLAGSVLDVLRDEGFFKGFT